MEQENNERERGVQIVVVGSGGQGIVRSLAETSLNNEVTVVKSIDEIIRGSDKVFIIENIDRLLIADEYKPTIVEVEKFHPFSKFIGKKRNKGCNF